MAFGARGGVSRLMQSAETTFLADGTATIQIGPTSRGEEWTVNRMIVSTTSTTDTECRAYRDSISDTKLLDGTYAGNQDVSETDITLLNPEALFFVWTGGSGTGKVANVRVEGTKRIRGFPYL